MKKNVVKYLSSTTLVILVLGLAATAYAAIGAEPSNVAKDETYPTTEAAMKVPPYPETGEGAAQEFEASARLMMQPTSNQPASVQPSSGAMPTMPAYNTAMPAYPVPTYGDSSGMMMYPSYSNASGGGGMMMYPAYTPPSTGGAYTYPQAGMMYPVPSSGGEGTGYPPTYSSQSPYGMMPAYPPGSSYQQPWFPQQQQQQQPWYPQQQQQQQPWYPQQQQQQQPWYPQQQQQQQYGSVDQMYNQAMQAYRRHDYQTAMTMFWEIANRYPQSDLADNAHYWSGEIYYAVRNFPAAIQAFQTVIYSYPNGNKAPDALLKMGYAYAELRQYRVAKSILNDVVARYSDNARIRNLAMKKLNELNNIY